MVTEEASSRLSKITLIQQKFILIKVERRSMLMIRTSNRKLLIELTQLSLRHLKEMSLLLMTQILCH